jgi:hypothetical protein
LEAAVSVVAASVVAPAVEDLVVVPSEAVHEAAASVVAAASVEDTVNPLFYY